MSLPSPEPGLNLFPENDKPITFVKIMDEDELNKFLLSIAKYALASHRRDVGQYFQLSEEELESLDEELERKDEAGELI